ncbi:hypothetical protein [Clostridium thermarum]|uniref:hypothetical protein n=1 Tax=Clostridium thermarum TaxID=1716543 RepID=UPI001121EC90|nr:hypothetical protein [Clostridium thermarum]
MKKKAICILIVSICIIGHYNSTTVAAEDFSSRETQLSSTSIPKKIKLLRSNTTLKHGDIGIITIKGEPGVVYKIESSYAIGSRVIPVNQVRTGNSKGIVTFNWVVGEDTVPGTYPIKISGNGEVLELTHTVLP